MRITLVGPGRAGTALALAARAAGHDIVAVLARRPEAAAGAAARVGSAVAGPLDGEFPYCDLVVVATGDNAVSVAARAIAGGPGNMSAAVHLSGLTPVAALEPFAARGLATGSFHPLQTFPTAEAGVARLRGAWIAVTTADEELRLRLHEFAASIGGHPFDLADEAKPLYHAAAAAAANFPLAALTMAADLFAAAGVPFDAAGPLIRAVVENALDMGPRPALTGPVARGDVATVQAQIQAIDTEAPEWAAGFRAFVAELAKVVGREEEFAALLGSDQEGTS